MIVAYFLGHSVDDVFAGRRKQTDTVADRRSACNFHQTDYWRQHSPARTYCDNVL